MPFASVNGVRLYYNIAGEGKPVVFIHGVGITSRVWDFQKDILSGHFTMVTYDLRGSGRSGSTPYIKHSCELLAEDLKGLIDYLGMDRVSLVGLSLGAAVALKFSLLFPQRVDKMLLSGAFADLNGVLGFVSRYFSETIGRLLMTRLFGVLAARVMLPSSTPEGHLFYHKNIISINSDEVAKYSQILNSYTITKALRSIKAPVLLLYGQHERPLHGQGRTINRLIEGSKMLIIPGVGHGWNGEKPELFSRMVIDFIKHDMVMEKPE